MQSNFPKLTLLCLLLPCGLGCQAMREAVPDVHKARLERASDLGEGFQEKRNQAEMQAARSHWQQGNSAACLDVVDQLLERDPEHAEALSLRSAVQQTVQQVRYEVPVDMSSTLGSNASVGNGRAVSAGQEVQDAVERAQAALAAGDRATAKQNLQWAMDANPENPDLATTLALLPLRYGQPELAGELAEVAIARFGPSASLVRTQGIANYRRGDHAVAARAFQQAISLDKHNPLTYRLAGHTLEKLGDSKTAAWHHREAQRLESLAMSEKSSETQR